MSSDREPILILFSFTYIWYIFPLGLLYLASVLEKEGHNVFVKDCYRNSWEEIKQELVELIKDYSPDIFGLSCNTLNRTSCLGKWGWLILG